jgi:hypothetical protein
VNEGSQGRASLLPSARHFATETGVSYRAHRRSATALPGFHPTPSLIGYGFFFGWAGVCFGCSGVGIGLCSRNNLSFPGNVGADDLLSKLLQIQFDIRYSLFQGFVFVWHMFVPI